MSSFPTHKTNIKALADMGFDVSHLLDEDGEATFEWTNSK